MEKKHSSCPLKACEKMFKAIASSSPFRRRISHYPQDPMSANHAPNSSPPASIPVSIIHDSPHHSKPVGSAQCHKSPTNVEATEAVPVKFKYSGLPTHSPPVQTNGKVANNIAPKVEPLLKSKPKADMSQPENHAIRKGRAQPGNTLVSSHGQVVLVSSRIEPEPPVVSQRNKTYAETNKAGANSDERFTNFINEVKSKIRNTSSNLGDGYKGRITSSTGDGKMVPGEDTTTSKDNFSDYINRAKDNMMRTMSSFGGGKSNSMK